MDNIHIVDDAFTFKTCQVHAEGEGRGAIDIETTVEEDPFVTLPELVSVAITFDGNRAFVFRDDEWLRRFRPTLENKEWIMHNGLFDRLMMRLFGYELELTHDTQAMQYLLDPDGHGRGLFGQKPNSLATATKHLLGVEEEWKTINYEKIKEEEWEDVARMNGEDVLHTYNIFRPLADQLNQDKQLSKLYQWLLMPAVNALIEVTFRGIPVDVERLERVTEKYEALVRKEKAELVAGAPKHPDGWPKPSWWRVREHGKYGGNHFNPNSPQQVGYVLFDHYELPVLEETETGNPSTSADTLLQLEVMDETPDAARDWLSTLRSYRKHFKLTSSYLEAWPRYINGDDKMHPRFRPLKVATGRLSSSNPNIQQVPRDKEFRSIFTAPEGHTWMKADYSQIELRIAAWLANEPTMLAAYENGDDIHALTAAEVLGDPSFRQGGKTLNFGLLYGAGPRTLQRIARQDYDVWFTFEEAKQHRQNFFRLYPKLETWQRLSENQIETSGIARSPLGRIRYLPHAKIPWEVEDMVGHKMAHLREGLNHRVQSFASDLTLQAVRRLVEAGYPVVAAVHDEVDLIVRDEDVKQTAETVKFIMEDLTWLEKFGINLTVPVLAEVEVGPNWGELEVAKWTI